MRRLLPTRTIAVPLGSRELAGTGKRTSIQEWQQVSHILEGQAAGGPGEPSPRPGTVGAARRPPAGSAPRVWAGMKGSPTARVGGHERQPERTRGGHEW
eukprot:gene25453-biopygen19496